MKNKYIILFFINSLFLISFTPKTIFNITNSNRVTKIYVVDYDYQTDLKYIL